MERWGGWEGGWDEGSAELIRTEKQLFIDGRLIEFGEHVTIAMNPPRKMGWVLLPD